VDFQYCGLEEEGDDRNTACQGHSSELLARTVGKYKISLYVRECIKDERKKRDGLHQKLILLYAYSESIWEGSYYFFLLSDFTS